VRNVGNLVFLAACAVVLATPAATATATQAHAILVLGDSISAGYGLPRDAGWVKLLGDRLMNERSDYSVVNASISGETTSGGRERLPSLLVRVQPAVVIVELGGNDGLRGLSMPATEENLSAIVQACLAAHTKVLLVGMQLPPNYGRTYTEQFAGLYPALAKRFHVSLVPFFFDGFATRMDLFQADGIHPSREAQPLLLDNVWLLLRPLLN